MWQVPVSTPVLGVVVRSGPESTLISRYGSNQHPWAQYDRRATKQPYIFLCFVFICHHISYLIFRKITRIKLRFKTTVYFPFVSCIKKNTSLFLVLCKIQYVNFHAWSISILSSFGCLCPMVCHSAVFFCTGWHIRPEPPTNRKLRTTTNNHT